MSRKYRSDAFEAIHETAKALHNVGAIGKKTMREFDDACLSAPETMTPKKIKALRERENVSQPIFARYLNVSKNLVSDWERGVKKPGGPALRLLTLVQHSGLDIIGAVVPSAVEKGAKERHRA